MATEMIEMMANLKPYKTREDAVKVITKTAALLQRDVVRYAIIAHAQGGFVPMVYVTTSFDLELWLHGGSKRIGIVYG